MKIYNVHSNRTDYDVFEFVGITGVFSDGYRVEESYMNGTTHRHEVYLFSKQTWRWNDEYFEPSDAGQVF